MDPLNDPRVNLLVAALSCLLHRVSCLMIDDSQRVENALHDPLIRVLSKPSNDLPLLLRAQIIKGLDRNKGHHRQRSKEDDDEQKRSE